MHARGTRRLRGTALALTCAGMLVLSACDGAGSGDGADGTDDGGFLGLGGDREGSGDEQDGSGDGHDASGDALTATTTQPSEGALVLTGEDGATLATAAQEALFETSPVVVLASEDESVRAASAAVALGVPVVVDGPGTAEQLEQLGAEVALAIGPVADPGIDVVVPTDDAHLAELLGVGSDAVTVDPDEAAVRIATLDPAEPQLLVPEGSQPGAAEDDGTSDSTSDDAAATDSPPLASDRDTLPTTSVPEPLAAVTVLSTGGSRDLAALGTARAAGAHLLVGPHTDPRATSESVQALASAEATTLIGLGEEFGEADDLAWKARTAATGVELPGGGQLVLPGKTYVALYGTPVTSSLGVLGEQPVEETITRAEEHAGWYEPLTDEPVVPTHEIIVTVASEGPGPKGNYSNELPIEQIEPLVDLAEEHGHYVVLDLQPGQTDFVTQAELYEELLVRPHVGLALDPEWRLGPGERHMVQIGHVDVEEVNEVVHWLADLTREHDLPQKVLVLHMFQTRMIPDVDAVDQSREEVAVLIHADGQGPQPDKQATWRALHDYAPSVEHWGWKNFYDEDAPVLSAEETMAQVDPLPDFISYQ